MTSKLSGRLQSLKGLVPLPPVSLATVDVGRASVPHLLGLSSGAQALTSPKMDATVLLQKDHISQK